MEKEPIMRLMEEKDLFDVPDAREEFEEHANEGNYFFFVIEDDKSNIIGYLIAKREDREVKIKRIDIPDSFKKMHIFVNMLCVKLFEYVSKIRNCDGTPVTKGVTSN